MTREESKTLRERITVHFEKGEMEEGLSLLEGEQQLPKAVYEECLGNMFFYKGDMQNAVIKYEYAITLDPDHPIARYQYLAGVQQEGKKDYVSAFKRYQYAIEIEPTFVDTYVELGAMLAKIGDFEGAVQCYRDAARLAPTLKNFHNLREILRKLIKDNPEKYSEELKEIESK